MKYALLIIFIASSAFLYGDSEARVGISRVTVIKDGQSVDDPIMEGDGNTAVIRCEISGQDMNDEWEVCKWTHYVEKEDSDDTDFFYCSVTKGGSSQADCSPSGVDSAYSKRIKVKGADSYCEISIYQPNYMDTGEWNCHISAVLSDNFVQGSTELFVSRIGEVYISEPDLESNSNQYIVYDLRLSRPRIYAKCRSYFSIPLPEFRWYVNEVDSRTEIAGPDVKERDPKPGKDSKGEYMEHTLEWTPRNLCGDFDMWDICSNWEFDFDLLCTIKQGDFYVSENEDNVKEGNFQVMVRVTGNFGNIAGVNWRLLFPLVALTLFNII